jgi:hypothetical protein
LRAFALFSLFFGHFLKDLLGLNLTVFGLWSYFAGWNQLRLRVAVAIVELLVATPTEVFGANVAIVGLRCLTVNSVCRIALWASYTLAVS